MCCNVSKSNAIEIIKPFESISFKKKQAVYDAYFLAFFRYSHNLLQIYK